MAKASTTKMRSGRGSTSATLSSGDRLTLGRCGWDGGRPSGGGAASTGVAGFAALSGATNGHTRRTAEGGPRRVSEVAVSTAVTRAPRRWLARVADRGKALVQRSRDRE
jgi:hypothetical protein